MAQRRAVGDARAPRDAAQARALEALVGEQLERGPDQAHAGGIRGGSGHVDSVYLTVDAVNPV